MHNAVLAFTWWPCGGGMKHVYCICMYAEKDQFEVKLWVLARFPHCLGTPICELDIQIDIQWGRSAWQTPLLGSSASSVAISSSVLKLPWLCCPTQDEGYRKIPIWDLTPGFLLHALSLNSTSSVKAKQSSLVFEVATCQAKELRHVLFLCKELCSCMHALLYSFRRWTHGKRESFAFM